MMKQYYPMAILYETNIEPYLWASGEYFLSADAARCCIELVKTSRYRRIVVSWIQEFDSETNERTDLEIKYYVNGLGLTDYGFAIERMKDDDEKAL